MKTLWIHSGMPKNGSSALQVFLAKNKNALLKEGLDYIELNDIGDAVAGKITSGNSALFARSLLHENHEAFFQNGKRLHKKLFGYLSSAKSENFLLSSEFFTTVPAKNYKTLKEDLLELGITLKIIFYVRRQDQFLMSSYMQRVKRHGYQGFPDDFVLQNYKKSFFLNYFGYTNLIENVVGKGNVLPNVYELTKNHEKGLVGHFISRLLGYVPEWIEEQSSINTSPSILELKFMLMSNIYKPRMNFSDFLIEDSISRGRSKPYEGHSILSAEARAEVLEHFREQNEKFFAKFLPGGTFPETEQGEFIDLKSFQFSANEMMEVVTGFLVRFDQRLAFLENKIAHNKKTS